MSYRAMKEPFDCLYAIAEQTRLVARPLPQLMEKNLFRAVQIRVGAQRFMVPLTDVDSFHRLLEIRPVPGMKHWLLGMSSIRGELVTLSSLAGFIEGEEQDISMDARLVVKGPFGLVVDEVDGLKAMPRSAFGEGIPEHIVPDYIPYLKGQVRYNDQHIAVLDVEAVLGAHAFEQVGLDEGKHD